MKMKRMLALLLTAAMLAATLPTAAFAAEEGPPCHPVHEGCGYAAPVEAQPCKHEQGEHKVNGGGADREGPLGGDEACGFVEGTPETPCNLGCAELDEAGAVLHGEGCAYAPAVEGTPCGHVEHTGADGCGYVEAVEGTECNHSCDLCATLDSGLAPGTSGQDGQKLGSAPPPEVALPTAVNRSARAAEQFNLAPGQTYWFDLSGAGIPGAKNTGNEYGAVTIPDTTLHWVPFTYAGTINAYKLTSAQATTEEYANNNKYDHSLFIADYAVTHTVSWEDLNASDKNMIFGKSYASGGVGYTIRVPSVGSDYTGNNGNSLRGTPNSNEWDAILDKANQGWKDNDTGYIKNWDMIASWGQDTLTSDASSRAYRGFYSARDFDDITSSTRFPADGFRPILELPAPGTLASDGLKVVSLDLNGGKAGTTATAQDGPVNIVVKSGEGFTAPSGGGLTRPDGYTGTYFKWLDSDGNRYDPGAAVPATVTALTAEWSVPVSIEAIQGVTPPARGAVPVSAITDTAQYTGTVAWSPALAEDGTFAADTEYTATITLAPKDGFTLQGVAENFFTVDGATATNDANSGIIKAVFPKTEKAPVSIKAIPGVTAPALGASPVTAIPETEEYTGTVAWSPALAADGTFAADTEYTATITLSPEPSYTLQGVAENFFTVAGATATNGANSGIVTAVFPATGATPTYTITADKTSLDFGSLPLDYATAPAAQTVTITNTGNQAVTLNQPTVTGASYDLGALSKTNLPVGETATFTVQPKTGLAKSTYTGTVDISNTQGQSVSVSLTFTVTDKPTYSVTVNGGTGGGSYEAGAAVTITATVPGGQQFKAWTGLDGLTITGGSVSTEKVTFTMPAQAVTATASFESQSSGGGGGGGGDTPSPTEQAVSKVEKAKDGDTVKVDLPSNGKLPNEILEAAAGKDITLEINAGNGVTWIINGKDIPKGKLADLNLKVNTKASTIPVTVINALTGEKNVMQIELRHNGPFGFPLTLRLETGKDSAGLWANLYYYDEAAKTLDYQAAAKIGADGRADLPFSHASSYAVVIDAASHGKTNPNTGGDNPFTDVKDTDWFFNAVMYVYHGGIMQGTSDTTFSPHNGTTRAQLATILWRMEGSPAPTGGNPFSDVPDGAWYSQAVAWCAGAELVGGYGGGLFGPSDPISREQLASLLYRYAVYKGWDVSQRDGLTAYADAGEVSSWARDAVEWAVGAGIMGGTTEGRLAPQAGATRAQISAMLMRLLERYAPGFTVPGTVTPNPSTGVLNNPQTGSSAGAGWLMLALPVSAAGAALCSKALRRRKKEPEPDPT